MAATYNKILANPQDCMSHLKDDLLKAAKWANISSVDKKNTKSEICSALIDHFNSLNLSSSSTPTPQTINTINKKRTAVLTEALEPNSIKFSLRDFPLFVNNLNIIDFYRQSFKPCKNVRDYLNTQYSLEYALQIVDTFNLNQQFVLNRGFDVANQEIVQCLVKEIFDQTTDEKYYDPNHTFQILTNKLKDYFTIKKLQSDSMFGSTFFVYPKTKDQISMRSEDLFKVRKPFAIMKLVQNFGSAKYLASIYSEIVHEVAVGFCLNSLRSKVPNFAYTYDGFICDILQQKVDKDSITCSKRKADQSTVISLQEFVPGRDITGVLVDFKAVIHIFLQVAHALYTAEQQFKYVHFDLHRGNVIITRLPSPITINLVTSKYNITLTNVSLIPYIIDYGKSALTSNTPKGSLFLPNVERKATEPDELYLNELVAQLGCCPDQYYVPTYDMFRYITHSISALDDSIYSELSTHIFAFFKKEIESKGLLKNPKYALYYKLITSKDITEFNSMFNDSGENFFDEYNLLNWGNKNYVEMFQKDSSEWILAFINSYKGNL